MRINMSCGGLLPATNENFLDQIKSYCEKGSVPTMNVSVEEIERGRELLKDLAQKWSTIGCGEELKFEL